MKFSLPDLNRSHDVVLAARLMQDLYSSHYSANEPCRLVLARFPELTPEQVMCLWVGVNMAECSIQEREGINLVEVVNV
ncbi:hypothetical protein [Vibrio penaeicida]|uniref:Uncharacterized protein n=1 Tax=Vibrio penaeicida TaxID=104609 RepID=A0AAV5NST2_9VIBR|nr:hypothetical protein [Vibrio penaeicida]RTZ22292.1 hypothetical protein EKN09_14895 [Vibrio penaeicida]GLQ73283.1 hypothetical protein GCM10007932_26430 [Vibrio penaeicida]